MDASVAKKPPGAARSGIAERLWDAARVEFCQRGYHGARVQGIARRASCNVALLYRHWTSKKALYLDVLRATWRARTGETLALVQSGGGAPAVVAAYVDSNMRDPMGAQILLREFLDGGPFLQQLIAAEPALVDPLREAARALGAPGEGEALRPGLDSIMTVLSVGGMAALVAAAHEAARPLLEQPIPAETWRGHVEALLLHGVLGR